MEATNSNSASVPRWRIGKAGAVLSVTVCGALTNDAIAGLRATASVAMIELRASACLIDLSTCVIEFDPQLLRGGFLHSCDRYADDRPSALVVAERHRHECNFAAREAALRGVLMPVFTSREPAHRFLEIQAALWWSDRRYSSPPPARPVDATALSRAAQDTRFQGALARLVGGASGAAPHG
jgi:hypothetical protein